MGPNPAAEEHDLMKIAITMTDLIYDGVGWSANGCWANRWEIELDEDTSDDLCSRAIRHRAGVTGDPAWRRDDWSGAEWSWRNGTIGLYAEVVS